MKKHLIKIDYGFQDYSKINKDTYDVEPTNNQLSIGRLLIVLFVCLLVLSIVI